MPLGTVEVLLVGAKGLENTDFLSKFKYISKKFFVVYLFVDYKIEMWVFNNEIIMSIMSDVNRYS